MKRDQAGREAASRTAGRQPPAGGLPSGAVLAERPRPRPSRRQRTGQRKPHLRLWLIVPAELSGEAASAARGVGRRAAGARGHPSRATGGSQVTAPACRLGDHAPTACVRVGRRPLLLDDRPGSAPGFHISAHRFSTPPSTGGRFAGMPAAVRVVGGGPLPPGAASVERARAPVQDGRVPLLSSRCFGSRTRHASRIRDEREGRPTTLSCGSAGASQVRNAIQGRPGPPCRACFQTWMLLRWRKRTGQAVETRQRALEAARLPVYTFE